MITTRALGGRAGLATEPGRSSVILLDILEKLAEIAGGEAAGGGLEPFHCPGPEVIVDRTGAVLDRAPQRPPVHTDQAAEQPGAGGPAAAGTPVIGPNEVVEAVPGQVRLGRDVPELEAGVVVARQLVVDQPDTFAVVDEVGREQVVVAGDGAFGGGFQSFLGRGEVRGEVVVAVRDAEAAGAGHGQVAALDAEHVEVVAEPAALVQPAAGSGDAREVLFAGYVGRVERAALDVADDKQAVLRAVLDHRRPGPGS